MNAAPDNPEPARPVGGRPLERALALLAALACLFITIAIWRDVSQQQAMWPLPGLYFIELPAVGMLVALACLVGHPNASHVAWAAAGIHGSFAVLGTFSVGLIYAPIAIIFIVLAGLLTVRRKKSFLQSLAIMVGAAIAQAVLMLAAIPLVDAGS